MILYILSVISGVLAIKNEAPVGWSENWQYIDEAAKIDAAPYCKLSGIDMCTIVKKRKREDEKKRNGKLRKRKREQICSMELKFENCDSIKALSSSCNPNSGDYKNEEICSEVNFENGKIKYFQGFINDKRKHARGLKLRTKRGHTYKLGTTPSKYKRDRS